MELNLNKIDWRLPPHELKAKIDSNFTQLELALKKVTEEINKNSSRFESLDGNIEIEPPKGISVNHRIRLSNKVEVKTIKSFDAKLDRVNAKHISTQEIESPIIKANKNGVSIDGIFVYNKEHGALTFGVDSELITTPKQRTRLRMAPAKDTAAHHSLIIQSEEGSKKGNFLDETTHLVVKGDGKIGIGTFNKLKATLTISGEPESQLCLNKSFTPSDKDDAPIGSFAWDEEYIYVKTKKGWKRSKLETV